jgi:8-oxo-dGTP diphosphatase
MVSDPTPRPGPTPGPRASTGASARDVPADYDPRDFPPFAVTVDLVVLTVGDDGLQVALVRRAGPPFEGWWALPGGFKRPDETLEAAAVRELGEEAGARVPRLAQLGAYGDPGRDPRLDVVTVAFMATVPAPIRLRAGTDASAARWAPVADVLDGHLPLAFDHARIVADARTRLADDLERTDAVLSLVPDAFTLTQLRRAYEAVWRLEVPPGPDRDAFALDRRNLRRALTEGPVAHVEPTGARTSDPTDTTWSLAHEVAPSAGPEGSERSPSTRRGRPAALHRATEAWRDGSPVRRPRARG